MLYYLDTMIVIYAVEGNPAHQQRALNHLAAARTGGPSVRDQRTDPHGMFGPGRWLGWRSTTFGLFPVLPRAEPADGESDSRNVPASERDQG